MIKELSLEVITPSKSAFKGNVVSVSVPGTQGAFQVLFNHAPIMSTFEIGKIKIIDPGQNEIEYCTGGGYIEVLANKILIMAESFEHPDEIDFERAKKAEERARGRLTARNSDIDIHRAEMSLQRSINRQKIYSKFH